MEVGFHGEYREIDPPHRLVSTEVFEGAPVPDPDDAVPTVNVVTFDEDDGVTTLTMVIQCINRKAAYAIIESAWGGLQVAYDQLEDLVRQQG